MSKSVRLADRSYEQADELRQHHGYESLTNVLVIAIDRLYQEEAVMYNRNDRVWQVNALRKLASDIVSAQPSEAQLNDAEHLVGWWTTHDDITMPEWYSEHDRELLIEWVRNGLA